MLKTIFYFCLGLYSFSITNAYCTSQEVDAYKELKILKKQSNFIVNKQYLQLLEQLKVIADQGDFEAQKHYISAVRFLKWDPDILVSNSMPSDSSLKEFKKWSNLDSIRNPIFKNMAQYRDNLIQKYEEDIRNCKNESEIGKIKFSLAKILLVSNQDDPGNKRKLKFLVIKKDLQNIPEWGEKINNWYENHKKALK